MDIQNIKQQKVISNDTGFEFSDQELVAKLRSGDESAFELIMRRYNQRLYRIARSILKDDFEAMDAVQEAYLKAYTQIEQFSGPTGFASWLSRITSNEAMMRIRKQSRISYTVDDPKVKNIELTSPQAQPLDRLASKQLRKLLEDAIDQLSVNNRSVYVMRAIEQLSTQETAASLSVSEDVVKTRYRRAKQSLQKTFQQHLDNTGLSCHEFAGHRCNSIVSGVIESLKSRMI